MSELDQKNLISVVAVAAMTATTHSLWLLTGFNNETVEPVRKLCEFFSSQGTDEECRLARKILDSNAFDNVAELAKAWTSFFGLGRMSITPHESVFRCGLAMQEPRDLTRTFMLKAGVKLMSGHGEPEDHLGVQLEFLGYLLEQSFADNNLHLEQLNLARSFLQERLVWVPAFIAKTKALANPEAEQGHQVILWLLELVSVFLQKLSVSLASPVANA